MQLHEVNDYAAAPDVVFAMLCDQAWREQVCRAVHALDYSVTIRQTGDQVHITTVRTMPAEVPEAIKRMVGERIEITHVERWGPAAADGSRSAELRMDVTGQPASMTGTMRLVPSGAGSRESIDGDVKVTVPFFGKLVEPEILKAVQAGIAKEGEQGRAYLAPPSTG